MLQDIHSTCNFPSLLVNPHKSTSLKLTLSHSDVHQSSVSYVICLMPSTSFVWLWNLDLSYVYCSRQHIVPLLLCPALFVDLSRDPLWLFDLRKMLFVAILDLKLNISHNISSTGTLKWSNSTVNLTHQRGHASRWSKVFPGYNPRSLYSVVAGNCWVSQYYGWLPSWRPQWADMSVLTSKVVLALLIVCCDWH